ncbi:LysE family translocator [Kordiimonas aestuarii]|uniref:LysE family translocator n=1 Tax=Kordiimonas aestuarii TaxID=1005925 RepID=UPI0021D208AC|nr:LysE family translocator [Kordiimonas aestuarii]
MLSVDTIIAFTIAATVLAFAPGPDNIFVLTQSALRGPKAGVAVTFGLATGLVVHTAAVVLGLAALIAVSEVAFTVLKVVGAAYLVYLAVGAFRARPGAIEATDARVGGLWQYYRRGIIMNVTNPKVSIFFLAFLPQFVDASAGNTTAQMLSLALIFFVVTLVVFSAVALMAGQIGNRIMGSPRAQVLMNRIAGTIFLGLAVKLAISER